MFSTFTLPPAPAPAPAPPAPLPLPKEKYYDGFWKKNIKKIKKVELNKSKAKQGPKAKQSKGNESKAKQSKAKQSNIISAPLAFKTSLTVVSNC